MKDKNIDRAAIANKTTKHKAELSPENKDAKITTSSKRKNRKNKNNPFTKEINDVIAAMSYAL